MEDSALKDQYRRLQEQQQRKLERLRDLQNGKSKLGNSVASGGITTSTPPSVISDSSSIQSSAFGVSDNLNLKGGNDSSLLTKGVVDSSESDVRQLKDENGRLYKLLSEKDCEIRSMKRKLEHRSQPPTRASIVSDSISLGGGSTISGNGIGGDVAAVKIMNLSKKIRDLTCELEAERTKTAQLTKRCDTLETENQRNKDNSFSSKDAVAPPPPNSAAALTAELTQVKDRLRQTESRLLETRNQHQITSQELKMAMKALSEEVGDPNVNIHDLLAGQSGWRGRQQKIITLQTRVRDLEHQLAASADSIATSPDLMVSEALSHSGATSFGRTSIATMPSSTSSLMGSSAGGQRLLRQREAVVKIQKARQEALEQAEKDLKQREVETEDLRRKEGAARARAKVLAAEVKTLKEKMTILLEKGRHDDELIASLLKQQTMLQAGMEAVAEAKRSGEVAQDNRVSQLEHEAKVIDRLKEIIAEKEGEIVRLQEHITGVDGHEMRSPTQPTQPPKHQRTVTPKLDCISRGVSPIGEMPSTLPPSVEEEQLRTLLATAEVERDRLRELTLVQERRCEDMLSKQITKDQEMASVRRRLVTLERQVQRLGGSLPASATASKSASDITNGDEDQPLLRDGLPVTQATVESLQRSLALSFDETVALKQAVKRALEAKQEDLKMLTDIVGQTRAQFLQGIRNVKEKLK